jgi:hypothetical protein
MLGDQPLDRRVGQRIALRAQRVEKSIVRPLAVRHAAIVCASIPD